MIRSGEMASLHEWAGVGSQRACYWQLGEWGRMRWNARGTCVVRSRLCWSRLVLCLVSEGRRVPATQRDGGLEDAWCCSHVRARIPSSEGMIVRAFRRCSRSTLSRLAHHLAFLLVCYGAACGFGWVGVSPTRSSFYDTAGKKGVAGMVSGMLECGSVVSTS